MISLVGEEFCVVSSKSQLLSIRSFLPITCFFQFGAFLFLFLFSVFAVHSIAMAFYKDSHGTPIFASNQTAIEHLDEGVLTLCIPTDPSSYVKKAVDLDQEMPMGI